MVKNFSDEALVLIDIQNDFCPGGALAVNEGNEIVSVVNNIQKKFSVKIRNTFESKKINAKC